MAQRGTGSLSPRYLLSSTEDMPTDIADQTVSASRSSEGRRSQALVPHPRGLHRHAEPISALWGVSPIAPIHFGFDRTLRLLKQLDDRGWRLSVVIADYHSVLSHGLQWPDVSNRSQYYQAYLRHCCGLNGDILLGSQFQTDPVYFEMLLRASSQTSLASVKNSLPSLPSRRAQGSWPDLGAAIYQVMQCVDAAYLGANAIVADAGQRKTYQLMENFRSFSAISHHAWRRGPRGTALVKQPKQLWIPTGIDLRSNALRDSTAATRVSIHETRESLDEKIQRMYAPPASQPDVTHKINALLWHFENSVFPWRSEPIIVESGGRCHKFCRFEDFQVEYEAGNLHPMDCKHTLADALWLRISSVQRVLAKVLVDWIRQ